MQSFIDIEAAYARKLIRDAAAYAASLWTIRGEGRAAIEAIFGDVDAGACTDTFALARMASLSS